MPSLEEIKDVFRLDDSSAAGPNGFTGKFFQSMWEIVANDILEAIWNFFHHGKLPQVSGLVVSKQQFGFIEGRRMHDAILLASVGVNAKHRLNRGQHCNSAKSKVFYGTGVSAAIKRDVRHRLCFGIGKFPVRYLGVPLFKGVPRSSYFASLVDSILDKFRKFTLDFINAFPEIVWLIIQIPISSKSDERMWHPSLFGKITPKLARLHVRNSFPSVKWASWMWDVSISEHRSITCWCVVHGYLATMDKMNLIGFVGPIWCVHCMEAAESIDHLFLHCSFVKQAWRWLFNLFGMDWEDFASFNQCLLFCLRVDFSSQVLKLWKVVVTFIWAMWTSRNQIIFENEPIRIRFIKIQVRLAIREADQLGIKMGNINNTVSDLMVLHAIGVKGRQLLLRNLYMLYGDLLLRVG